MRLFICVYLYLSVEHNSSNLMLLCSCQRIPSGTALLQPSVPILPYSLGTKTTYLEAHQSKATFAIVGLTCLASCARAPSELFPRLKSTAAALHET